jgi:hypothetical protein
MTGTPRKAPAPSAPERVSLVVRVALLLLAVAYGFVVLPLHVFMLPLGWPIAGLGAAGIVVALLLRVALRGWRFDRRATVTFVVALLASIASTVAAMQRMTRAFNSPYITAMKSELRNLAEAQRLYRDSTGHFATDVGILSRGNRDVELQLLDVTDSGWRAVARHPRVKETCSLALAHGESPPPRIPCER